MYICLYSFLSSRSLSHSEDRNSIFCSGVKSFHPGDGRRLWPDGGLLTDPLLQGSQLFDSFSAGAVVARDGGGSGIRGDGLRINSVGGAGSTTTGGGVVEHPPASRQTAISITGLRNIDRYLSNDGVSRLAHHAHPVDVLRDDTLGDLGLFDLDPQHRDRLCRTLCGPLSLY